MPDSIIQFKHISKTYHQNGRAFTALDDVSLDIYRGEVFGIIGQSGAGKSTLLRCINGLEVPDQGDVYVCEQDLSAQSLMAQRELRHKIGMIFQHFNLLSRRTAYDNIALPLEFQHLSIATQASRIQDLLKLTGLEDKQKAYPEQLSGGQKQREAIARALVTEPNILLCDEATSALDPQTTTQILQLLRDINQTLGLTIVLITHEMDVIKQIADRVAVMHEGKVVEVGKVIDVFSAPQAPVTQALVQHLFTQTLPERLLQRLSNEWQTGKYPLLHIAFTGEVADQPVIAELNRRWQVLTNILQAHLETVQGELLGHMLIEIQCKESAQLTAILEFLNATHVRVEVLGYV